MKICVVGGTGHVGTHLCEILRERGHEVVILTRGLTSTNLKGYKSIACDSKDVEAMKKLHTENFDTIMCFPGCVDVIYKALADKVNHIIGCGSLWMLGNPKMVPTPEITQAECIVDAGYKRRYALIQEMIAESKCKFTAIMPPNISGPGKVPIDFLGDRDVNNHLAHKNGTKIYLPDGPECLIEPTDAYDIAMLFALCAEQPEKAGGQIFNVGTGRSMTATEFINALSQIFGSKNEIEYVPWKQYRDEISPSIYHWWHFYAHMSPDITKAKTLVGYKPKYSAVESLERAVKWMYDNKLM